MISNLKHELSHIKQDVEKLKMDEEFEIKARFKGESSKEAARLHLDQQKEVEEDLRKELRELKQKITTDQKLKDERTGYLNKEIEILKREQDILLREKEEALLQVSKLRREGKPL